MACVDCAKVFTERVNCFGVPMRIKIEHSKERLTRRSGMVLVDEFGRRVDLRRMVDRVFGPPGSGRGRAASEYVTALVDMFIDGALTLEHVRMFEQDHALKTLTGRAAYPSPDALGDWLRRHGGVEGERKMWMVQHELLGLSRHEDVTLDIDATVIEAEKGDGKESYKGIVGYQPMLGVIAENGVAVGSEFRYGNASPQSGLVEFITSCRRTFPRRIARVRSDSAAYQTDVLNYLTREKLQYTISADQNATEMAEIHALPEAAWKAVSGEAYLVAETVHTFNGTAEAFRLVAKRTPVMQMDLFTGEWKYWLVATNIAGEEMDAAAIVKFHAARGEMERIIGELKAHFNLDHMPCGQFAANALYFAVGLLAYNVVQLMKQIGFGKETMTKSIRTMRYELMHLAGRVVTHARYLMLQVAAPQTYVERLKTAYLALHLAPFGAPA